MSESEPPRLPMSAGSMGMGGSLPPLSLPPLALPPMKTDQLGLSPSLGMNFPSSITQALHSPIPTNIASPSNHVGSPQPTPMFPQTPNSPIAFGNGSPRQMPVKRRFPSGHESPVVFHQARQQTVDKFNDNSFQRTEPILKQLKSVPGSPNPGSNPSTPLSVPIMRHNSIEAVPSPSALGTRSPSNQPSPAPSPIPNGNGPIQLKLVHPGQMGVQPPTNALIAQQQQQQIIALPLDFRGVPNGNFHPAVTSAPSTVLYHKPRPNELPVHGPTLQHIPMRSTTSQYAHNPQQGQVMTLQNTDPVPIHPSQIMQHPQQQTAYQQQQVVNHPPPSGVPFQQQAQQPHGRIAVQHHQAAVHQAIVQQRILHNQGMVNSHAAAPPQQQQQPPPQQTQTPMSQAQIKQILTNRLGSSNNGPPANHTPVLQQVLTRNVPHQQRLPPGAIVAGPLHPSQANMPVRSILAAQHQAANGRPGSSIGMPMAMLPPNAGQPLVHPSMVAQRSNPSAAMQLARLIDEKMPPTTSNKEQYRLYKKKFKYLVFENECYQEELRNLQRKLLKLSRDKNFLLDRLMQFEKVSDSSDDDSDSSQKTVDDRPKAKKRIRTQRRRASPHERANTDGGRSVSGTPSPCPSPAPGNLLAQMLQPSTSAMQPMQELRREDSQMRFDERRIIGHPHSSAEMQRLLLARDRPPEHREPGVNGYPSGSQIRSSQFLVAPGPQSLSHLNGLLPSTPSAPSVKNEEFDQKPVI